MTDVGWISALASYAERLHDAAGSGHQVVSTPGAWVLVALCTPLADGEAHAQTAEVLGADPMAAAHFAAELLTAPHPLVSAGTGVWMAPVVATPAMDQWRDGLPAVMTTGDIPTQAALAEAPKSDDAGRTSDTAVLVYDVNSIDPATIPSGTFFVLRRRHAGYR